LFKYYVNRWEKYLGGILLFAVTILVFMQVIFRYVLQLPVAWIEEWMLCLFEWLIWLGAITATYEERHVRVELFMKLLPPKAQRFMDFVTDAIWFAFCVGMGYAVWLNVSFVWKKQSTTIVAKIPYWFCTSSVLIGMIGMAIRLIQVVIRKAKNQEIDLRPGEVASENDSF